MNPLKSLIDKKNANLDERQLYLKGNIFQHGFLVMIVLILINSYISLIFEIPQIDSIIILAIALQ